MTAFAWAEELPVISGKAIELGPLRDEDIPALFAIFGDPEVTRFWSSPPLRDERAARALFDDIRESFRARRLFQWGIRRPGDPRVLGTCTLFNLDRAHRRAEIGFAVDRREWGKGIASRATAALIQFAFETLDLHRLEADADPKNVASLRVLERHGFKREGYLRERYHQGGEVQDAVFLGLLSREWAGSDGRG
jgi:RimJ/RimL family protein N-acetyltransferase